MNVNFVLLIVYSAQVTQIVQTARINILYIIRVVSNVNKIVNSA